MFAVISSERIELPPGTVVRLLGSWQDYLALSDQRGDKSIPRMKYRSGEILLMSPLPVQGRNANLLADIVKAVLDHFEQEYDAFTPITMTLPEESGIEPDYCFYIDNWATVSGKKQINWRDDPPPDLVIEMDVTSYSDVNDYLPYKVPEVWLFKKEQLEIYGLVNGSYVTQNNGCFFPDVNILEIVAECIRVAYERNTSAAIRSLRRKLEQDLESHEFTRIR